MRERRWWLAAAFGALAVLLGASIAMAAELEDGDYTLTVPGVGEFEFSVDSEEEETVTATAAPEGYEVDDDDTEKVAWKNEASLEVEVKTDKVEADVDWTLVEGGTATLSLPGGGSIILSDFNAEDGTFMVSVTGDWFAFGSGSDWYVASDDDISDGADHIFKVEATSDGIEIIAVDEADEGFINDLDDEEEDELEIDEEEDDEDEQEDEEEEDGGGPPGNPGRP